MDINLDSLHINVDSLFPQVIPGSHLKGICRIDEIEAGAEVICPVPKGGIMIMKPLLVHASGRSMNQKRRRVIHIEFSRQELPAPLQWSERMNFL